MKNLRRDRILIGWTQFELAKQTGVERSKLSLIENGHIQPTPAERDAIESAILKKKKALGALLLQESGAGAA